MVSVILAYAFMGQTRFCGFSLLITAFGCVFSIQAV